MSAWKNIALLTGGFLIGTAGVKILGSKEARKVYAHTTAAVIRAKDCVMTKADEIREGCGDILAEASRLKEALAVPCDRTWILNLSDDVLQVAGVVSFKEDGATGRGGEIVSGGMGLLDKANG